MPIDPFAPMQQALQTFGGALAYRGRQERQRRLDELTLAKLSQQQAKEARQMRTEERDVALKKFDFLAKLAPTVTDEPSYQRAVQQYTNIFGSDPNIPQQYDPAYVSQLKDITTKVQEQVGYDIQTLKVGGKEGLYYVPKIPGRGKLTPVGEDVTKPVPEKESKAFDRANKLLDKFRKDSGDFMKVRDSYTRVQQSAQNPSAAGDLALIFNYMKILDPGSVVRESEFATAQNAAGVPVQIRNLWNRLLEGERLAPEQRLDFVGRAEKLYSGMATQHSKRVGEYTRLAKKWGLDPETVIMDIMPAQAAPPSPETAPPAAAAAPAAPANVQDMSDAELLQMLGVQ